MKIFNPLTLIPKIRSTKNKNGNYKIIILKGFPGLWAHGSLIKWLEINGFDASIIDYGLQIRKVDYYVDKLEKHINKNYSDRKIILLGFSMGGLITVRFAEKTKWKNVEKIITFATPFKGSQKAEKYKMLPATSDMSPNSDFLKEIYDIKIPNNKLISISGKTDDLVDNSGTFLEGSKHITLDVDGHSNAQVLENIKPILEKELGKYRNYF